MTYTPNKFNRSLPQGRCADCGKSEYEHLKDNSGEFETHTPHENQKMTDKELKEHAEKMNRAMQNISQMFPELMATLKKKTFNKYDSIKEEEG